MAEERIVLKVDAKNISEVEAAFDVLNDLINCYGDNEEIHETIVVIDEGKLAERN